MGWGGNQDPVGGINEDGEWVDGENIDMVGVWGGNEVPVEGINNWMVRGVEGSMKSL